MPCAMKACVFPVVRDNLCAIHLREKQQADSEEPEVLRSHEAIRDFVPVEPKPEDLCACGKLKRHKGRCIGRPVHATRKESVKSLGDYSLESIRAKLKENRLLLQEQLKEIEEQLKACDTVERLSEELNREE